MSHKFPNIIDTTQVPAESELELARYSDGRLLVNGMILEGELFEDGVTQYYYTLSNNEVLTFLYDSVNDALEIVESNDEEMIPEEHIHEDGHYYDESFHGDEGNQKHDECCLHFVLRSLRSI